MRQNEVVWCELRRLIVVLEGLVEVALLMISTSHLVAAFSPHGLVLCVVEGVQRQVLNFDVVFFEKEVVGEVIQDHRVGGVICVGLRQHLNTPAVGVRLVHVQFENSEAD